MDALDRVINKVGSQQALAALIGGVQTRVSEWKRRGQVAGDAVIPVCRAVDFEVTPNELRPDLYPHPDDGLPADRRAAIAQGAT